MTDHKYGPKGHIVDAFIEHLRKMTETDWDTVLAAGVAEWNAVRYAGDVREVAGVAQWDAAGYARNAARAAWDAAGYARFIARDAWHAGDTARLAARDAAWDAAGVAAWEIQGADLMRERGQSFVFLPMFGFADEQAVLAALQPMEETK